MAMTKEARIKFFDLAGHLSPEDLHCDGEISHAQAMAKEKKLLKTWHDLEKEVNEKITEDEIWDWYLKLSDAEQLAMYQAERF